MSTPITEDDVMAIAPQLAPTDGAWVMILAFVNAFRFRCDESLRKLALCFLGAHLAELCGSVGASGATGPVISEQAGGLSRVYAAASTDYELSRTTYGQQFLMVANFNARARGAVLG